MNVLDYRNDVMAIATFDIDFGRYLYDPDLALDPRKFVNPQLKITHNKASGGTTPDAGELAVFANTFDEKKVEPKGFLMSKEQYDYTLVASGMENIDLAVDHPYRLLMLMSLSTSLQPWSQYNKVKLSQDNDRKVIINNEQTSNLLKMLRMHPRLVEKIIGTTKNGTQTFPCAASYERYASLVGLAADSDAYVTDTYGSAIKVADGAASSAMLLVAGYNPFGSLAIPFGLQNEIEDWFDMKNTGSLRLSLKGGSSASGTCEVVSQQVRTYAD